jgi:hypothetical protein
MQFLLANSLNGKCNILRCGEKKKCGSDFWVFVFHRKPEGREDENDDGKGIRDKQKNKSLVGREGI